MMFLKIAIGPEYNTPEHRIDALRMYVSEKEDLCLSQPTYNHSKREYISRFVEFALEMRLWTAPIVIASKHPFNAPAFREVGRIFEVGDLHLFDYHLLIDVVVAAVDHDIVRLDI